MVHCLVVFKRYSQAYTYTHSFIHKIVVAKLEVLTEFIGGKMSVKEIVTICHQQLVLKHYVLK